jgi:hypothetical protein
VDQDAFDAYADGLDALGEKVADERTEAFRRAVSERFLDMLEADPELRTKVLNYGNDDWRTKALKRMADYEKEARGDGLGTLGTYTDWMTRTSPKD